MGMKKMKDRKMQRWIQKMTVVLLALVLVLGIPVSARAEGGVLVIDPDREDCSITLTLAYKDNGEDKELQGGELSLYTVASVKEENGYHFDVPTQEYPLPKTVYPQLFPKGDDTPVTAAQAPRSAEELRKD